MKKRDLVSITDLSRDDVHHVFRISRNLKDRLNHGERPPLLQNRVMAMIFEKPSLRTRVTFEVGMLQLGGHVVTMSNQEVGVGKRETCHDIAKNLERWVDLLTIRTYGQDTVEQLAEHARIPVINALTDAEHPCQALTDLFTLTEHFDTVEDRTLVFIGDGNNVCASLMLLCPLVGVHITVACPKGYAPPRDMIARAEQHAADAGTRVRILQDPVEAVRDADAIYTDVWASMGQESERETRNRIFMPYQVNSELLSQAPPGVKIMHDLPARRGLEITDDVMDSEHSIVFDQAENRLHVQKGIMVYLAGEPGAARSYGVQPGSAGIGS